MGQQKTLTGTPTLYKKVGSAPIFAANIEFVAMIALLLEVGQSKYIFLFLYKPDESANRRATPPNYLLEFQRPPLTFSSKCIVEPTKHRNRI